MSSFALNARARGRAASSGTCQGAIAGRRGGRHGADDGVQALQAPEALRDVPATHPASFSQSPEHGQGCRGCCLMYSGRVILFLLLTVGDTEPCFTVGWFSWLPIGLI